MLFARPIALIAPCLEIGIGSAGQEHRPGRPKAGAGLVETGGGAGGAFVGPRPRVEAAGPTPRVFVDWDAGPQRDRAEVNVAVKGAPALLACFGIAAADKGGHGRIQAAISQSANKTLGNGDDK